MYIKVKDVLLLRCQRSKIIDKHLITVGIDGFQLLFNGFFQSSLGKVELLLCLLAFLLSLQLFLLRLLHLQAYLLNFILQGGKLFLQMNILVGGLLLLFLCLLQTQCGQSVLLLYLIIFALQLTQLFGLLLGMVLQKFKELVKLQHIGLRRGIGILLQLL